MRPRGTLMQEKRIDRLDVPRQLRVGQTLGRLVRRLAQQEQRTIQRQMVVLIEKGIEQHCRENGNEVNELLRQNLSDSVG